jgi:hypothetical protein
MQRSSDPACDKSALDHAPAIKGVIYLDGDGSDASQHECGYDRSDTYQAGIEVSLIGVVSLGATTSCTGPTTGSPSAT